jgi:hypothetical protein
VSEPPPPPRRVVVTHPSTRAARRSRRTVVRDIDEQTVVGELLIRSLVRAQLILAIRIVAIFAALLGGLPLLFAVSSTARSLRVMGIPLPWLVLGVLVYPVLIAGGWLYTRLAERNERDFLDVVDRS